MRRTILFLTILLLVLTTGTAPARSRSSGVYVGEVRDRDGDMQILMESKWISMHLMPSESMTIMRFVFRPTGNDILREVQPKFVRGGGGLLQDNLWEQDWRYQELRSRFYDYKILKRGPEEAQIAFQTQTTGYVGYVNSGIISSLLSDITIRRTVTLKADTPYFRVDVELINDDPDGRAKMPMFWPHSSSIISPEFGDQVDRPSARGVRRMGGEHGFGEDYIHDFNEGWTARVSPERKEGVVYLMDYDYLLHLYNCLTTTTEWMYDNVLVLNDRPWKSRIYVIPVMGLSRVDYANEFFVAQVKPRRSNGELHLDYTLTSSYRNVRKVSINPTITSGHLSGEPTTRKLSMTEISDVGVEPRSAAVRVEDPPADPFVINTTAWVELPDGALKKCEFQNFHVGDYGYGDNVRKDLKTPVAKLDDPVQKPFVPTPDPDQAINRDQFNVFGVMGCNSRAYGVEEALGLIEGASFDRGDSPGFTVSQNGLTDFPYDYDRLFDYRVLLYSNSDARVLRRVGASILVEYVRQGGGLVFLGGDSAFTRGIRRHEFADYLPLQPSRHSIEQEILRLNSPFSDHPIFEGVDLSSLPWAQFYHDLELNPSMEHEVLLKVGDRPFIVESRRGESRILTVLCVPFHNPEEMPEEKTHYLQWEDWPRLLSNVIRYAGQKR